MRNANPHALEAGVDEIMDSKDDERVTTNDSKGKKRDSSGGAYETNPENSEKSLEVCEWWATANEERCDIKSAHDLGTKENYYEDQRTEEKLLKIIADRERRGVSWSSPYTGKIEG